MADKMVPSWLTGTWIRSYIRRSSKESSANNKDVDDDQHFGELDTSISVRYIQTPWAFVDIRSKSTILSDDDDKEELVYDGVFEEMYNPNEYESLSDEEEAEIAKMNREQRRAAEKKRKKRKLPFKGFGSRP